jgi:hypothetical protein
VTCQRVRGVCVGTVAWTGPSALGSSAAASRRVTFAKGHYRIKAGKSKRVKLRLTKRGRRVLRHRKKIVLTEVITETQPVHTTHTRRVTIRSKP